MSKFSSIIVVTLSILLAGCGSMSFGESVLGTLTVFGEAHEIKQCYEGGGSREVCEGSY